MTMHKKCVFLTLFTPLWLVALIACQPDSSTVDESKSSAQQHDHNQHQHGILDISSFGEDTPIPSIELAVLPDSMSGWNIHITRNNFIFTPEKVNLDATPGEGHAHLYVDDYKFARLYGDWFHLKKLTPGQHTVRITLNANDHSTLSYNGKVISAEVVINQL